MRFADRPIAITGCSAHSYKLCDAVARGILLGDGNRARIDIGRKHLPLQELCRRNRENAGSGSNIQRSAITAAS
jgi:hypothetical protein